MSCKALCCEELQKSLDVSEDISVLSPDEVDTNFLWKVSSLLPEDTASPSMQQNSLESPLFFYLKSHIHDTTATVNTAHAHKLFQCMQCCINVAMLQMQYNINV